MADYGKQTVAQLRQLLKDRGIPSTGLQRKAQIVERLQEADEEAEHDEEDAPGGEEASNEDADSPSDAEAQPTAEAGAGPAPAASPALDRPLESTPQVESGVPAPEEVKTSEKPAKDAATEQEPSTSPPTEVPQKAPADAEETGTPKAAEDNKEENMEVEQPEAPAQAEEALQSSLPEPETSVEHMEPTQPSSRSSPMLNEKPSIEKADLLLIPERSTTETSRLNTEELEADSKKRKRRSGTPELPSQDIRAKKIRPSEEPVPEVYLKEDVDVVMEQRRPEEQVQEVAKEDSNRAHSTPVDKVSPVEESDPKRDKRENSSRYKNLVKPSTQDAPVEAIVDDRPTIPALHPVTSALYIRNFMRPLRPEPLRAHLASLASPPSSSPDASIVQSLFLDAMKTHALVSFSNPTAASRVRASLHGSIWPPEGNRKELWVDFIPADRVEAWTKEEEDAITAEKEARANGRSYPAKRFEVAYPQDIDGTVTAVFQEVGALSNFPTQRLSTQQPQQAPLPTAQETQQDIKDSFKTLDELFLSTAAKPQLFYLPVSDDVSAARLRDLAAETSKDWVPTSRKGRGLQREAKFKYSFDGEDRVVEVGDDVGPWAEGGRGGRGGWRGRGGGRGGGYGGGGFGGGGYRGGYDGRGGVGWRD